MSHIITEAVFDELTELTDALDQFKRGQLGREALNRDWPLTDGTRKQLGEWTAADLQDASEAMQVFVARADTDNLAIVIYPTKDAAIAQEIIPSLGEYAEEYNVDAIADEVLRWCAMSRPDGSLDLNRSGYVLLSEIDFWAAVEHHALIR